MTEMLESESLHASEIQDLQPSELSQITEIKILDAEAFASWWESLDRKTQDRLAKDYRTGFREAARRNRDEIAALTKAHL
jgi:hypothetical protein